MRINEELSISDHVLNVTDKIYDIIMSQPENRRHVLRNFDFISRLDITIDQVFYENGGATGRSNGDTATLDSNNLLVCAMEIEANFRKDLYNNLDSEMNYVKSTIQHEVEHLYQAYRKLINQQHTC